MGIPCLLILFLCSHSSSAFLEPISTNSVTGSSRPVFRRFSVPFLPIQNVGTVPSALHAGFEQQPGESTTDFIKRITANADAIMNEQKPKTVRLTTPSNSKRKRKSLSTNPQNSHDMDNSETEGKPKGTYQRIEDWDAERNAKGELTWEEKVQFDGQRYGNQVKQDSILRRHLGTF